MPQQTYVSSFQIAGSQLPTLTSNGLKVTVTMNIMDAPDQTRVPDQNTATIESIRGAQTPNIDDIYVSDDDRREDYSHIDAGDYRRLAAAEDDEKSRSNHQPATMKLKLLPQVMEVLRKCAPPPLSLFLSDDG